MPGVGLYFATIHGLKGAFNITGEPTAMESLLLGMTGRSFSGVLMIPFTVIKTRFEVRSEHELRNETSYVEFVTCVN